MKCPHCGVNFHGYPQTGHMHRGAYNNGVTDRTRDGEEGFWSYMTDRCPACNGVSVFIGLTTGGEKPLGEWRMVHPIGANRGPVSKEVPPHIANDYTEACNVLPISAKASAALSRRCLQNIIHEQGYKTRDLYAEINLLLDEKDPIKAIPRRLRETIDAVRNFGNFSAHPIDDKTALQVIDVEPEEAIWCLEILEECFEHFYVGPAIARERNAALNAKLEAAGKRAAKV